MALENDQNIFKSEVYAMANTNFLVIMHKVNMFT